MNDSVFHLDRDSIEAPLHRFAHYAMNCEWEILIAGEEAEYARQAAFAAWDEVDRIEADISRFMLGSDVSRLNAAQPGEEIRIGPAALQCLLLAGEISEQTQGAFDVMVAGAMDELRAGRERGAPVAETALIEVDPQRGIVQIAGEGVAIDFGALGKGYAIDRILELLREWSIEAALAHSGGSTSAAMGAPPGLEAWPLALRDPRSDDLEAILAMVPLRDAALSGSSFQTRGRHIIDPRIGAPVEGKLGAWALCETAARSDGISTALMVMEPDEINAFFKAHRHDSGLVLIGDRAQPQIIKHGVLANLELTFGAIAPAPEPETSSSDADPILRPFLGREVRIIWREGEQREGTLVAAGEHWIHLKVINGGAVLVPREAISRIEML